MKVLIIFASPAEKSFITAIADTVANSLQSADVDIVVRDLYRINFDPVLSQEELRDTYNNQISNQVSQEQNYIQNADICIWLYPLWWGGMPAIMRGYIDRVLSYGFAYSTKDGASFGLLANKQNFIIHTIGNSQEKYQLNGMTTAIETITNEGVFKFCGSSVEKFFHLFSVYDLTDAERSQIIADISKYFVTLVSK